MSSTVSKYRKNIITYQKGFIVKKIVLFGFLLLNCSLMVYAMDENGYELIAISQQETRPGVRTNVIFESSNSTKNTDGTWECRLCLYLASDVSLGAPLPVNKKIERIFLAKQKFEEIRESFDSDFCIVLQKKDTELPDILNVIQQVPAVVTTVPAVVPGVPAVVPAAQMPKETPDTSGQTQFDPLPENLTTDQKPTKQYSWSFVVGTGAAFTVAAILFFYQLHCLPDAFMHFIDNLRSGFRGQS